MNTTQELTEQGHIYDCIGCRRAFKELRIEPYEDGHGGRDIVMCKCGCDLIMDLRTGKPAKRGEP